MRGHVFSVLRPWKIVTLQVWALRICHQIQKFNQYGYRSDSSMTAGTRQGLPGKDLWRACRADGAPVDPQEIISSRRPE